MDHAAALRKEPFIRQAATESPDETGLSANVDNRLVEHVLAGDEDAFECIFDRHKRRVAITASRFFKNPAEIEEIVQQSFTKAFVELENFRGLHEFSFASWLGRIATSICLNQLKSRTAKLETLITSVADRDLHELAADLRHKSAEELVVQRDLLEKILSPLKSDDRALLQMLYAEEMSVSDVAEAFGWSRAKVKVKAFRARRALAGVVKKYL